MTSLRLIGHRIRQLVGPNASISVLLSPFERAQQTLYCALMSLGEDVINEVHVDPRIREQEFGNLQEREDRLDQKKMEKVVGRFYYRRPEGESSADVYDRVSDCWESIVQGPFALSRRFEHR